MDENTKELSLKEIQDAAQEYEQEELEEEDEKESAFEKISIVLAILVGIGVLATLIYGGYTVYNMFTRDNSFHYEKVPDFKGRKYSEVEDFFSQPEYSKVILNKKVEYRADIEEDIVITQKYERRDLRDNMYFTVSGGYDPDEEVVLPSFKGMTQEEAQKFLDENHLTKYEFIEKVFQNHTPGNIVSFTPEKSSVKRSEKLTFVVSKKLSKEGNMFLPFFDGKTKEEIEKWCKDNNLEVVFIEEASEDIEKGKMIRQNPVADTEVEPKSKVEITLSKGDVIMFGTVIGKKIDAVKTSMDIQEVKYNTVTIYDYRTSKDTVVKSDPDGNIEIERNSTITLYVSGGKPTLTQYIGKTRDELQDAIYEMKKNGAKFTENYIEDYSDSLIGTVLSLSNSGEINENASVSIHISKGPQIYAQNFSGKTRSEIENFANTNAITLNSAYRYSNLAEGTVISNTPSKGTIDRGSTMSVVYSLGKYTPRDYSGYQYADVERDIAEDKSNGADVVILTENIASDNVERGRVISQTFNNGVLTLRISTGKDVSFYQVEDLVGISVDAAKNTQTCKLFNCVFRKDSSSSSNIIIAQDIVGEYQKGTTVTLTY